MSCSPRCTSSPASTWIRPRTHLRPDRRAALADRTPRVRRSGRRTARRQGGSAGPSAGREPHPGRAGRPHRLRLRFATQPQSATRHTGRRAEPARRAAGAQRVRAGSTGAAAVSTGRPSRRQFPARTLAVVTVLGGAAGGAWACWRRGGAQRGHVRAGRRCAGQRGGGHHPPGPQPGPTGAAEATTPTNAGLAARRWMDRVIIGAPLLRVPVAQRRALITLVGARA